MVKEENNGVLDKSFSIDWDKFKNSIIVTNVEGTKKISTRVFEIIDFEVKIVKKTFGFPKYFVY